MGNFPQIIKKGPLVIIKQLFLKNPNDDAYAQLLICKVDEYLEKLSEVNSQKYAYGKDKSKEKIFNSKINNYASKAMELLEFIAQNEDKSQDKVLEYSGEAWHKLKKVYTSSYNFSSSDISYEPLKQFCSIVLKKVNYQLTNQQDKKVITYDYYLRNANISIVVDVINTIPKSEYDDVLGSCIRYVNDYVANSGKINNNSNYTVKYSDYLYFRSIREHEIDDDYLKEVRDYPQYTMSPAVLDFYEHRKK